MPLGGSQVITGERGQVWLRLLASAKVDGSVSACGIRRMKNLYLCVLQTRRLKLRGLEKGCPSLILCVGECCIYFPRETLYPQRDSF